MYNNTTLSWCCKFAKKDCLYVIDGSERWTMSDNSKAYQQSDYFGLQVIYLSKVFTNADYQIKLNCLNPTESLSLTRHGSSKDCKCNIYWGHTLTYQSRCSCHLRCQVADFCFLQGAYWQGGKWTAGFTCIMMHKVTCWELLKQVSADEWRGPVIAFMERQKNKNPV